MSSLPSTRAELSVLRWSAKVGYPASVPAAVCWGHPAARVWSCGTADPSIPVAQKWSPDPQRHKEETHGEDRLLGRICHVTVQLFTSCSC